MSLWAQRSRPVLFLAPGLTLSQRRTRTCCFRVLQNCRFLAPPQQCLELYPNSFPSTVLRYFAQAALSRCCYRTARTYLHFTSVFLSVPLRFPTAILQRFNQSLMFEFLPPFRRCDILTFRVQRERKRKNSIVTPLPLSLIHHLMSLQIHLVFPYRNVF